MLEAVVTLLFGSPRAVLLARVLGAMTRLCPCPAHDLACVRHHLRAAAAVAEVVADEPDPDEAEALLLGTGAHETQFRTERQVLGPAVTYWQLEVRASERAALLADPAAAARRALRVARCGMAAYAGAEGVAAEELRVSVTRARLALAAQ